MSPRRRYKLISIVEGHGEQKAVPVLVRRWFRYRNYTNFGTNDLAVRAAGCGALKVPHNTEEELGIEHYMEIALLDNPDAILVVIDADKECTERRRTNREGLGPELLRRAQVVSRGVPTAVVVANREFEVWFIAATERLRSLGEFVSTATFNRNARIETISSCKGKMPGLLGSSYNPSSDQHRLAQGIPFTQAMRERSPSFGKLLKELDRLCQQARQR